MKKNKLILSIFLVLPLMISSCTTYTIHDNRIRVHFINRGEKAPFSGVLLNNYTYQALKNKAQQCKESVNGRKKN